MDFNKRFKNGTFIASLVSILLLFAQQAYQASFFPKGIEEIFNTLLLMIAMLGVCIDPTTKGIMDNVDNEIVKIIKEKVKDAIEEKLEEAKKEVNDGN